MADSRRISKKCPSEKMTVVSIQQKVCRAKFFCDLRGDINSASNRVNNKRLVKTVTLSGRWLLIIFLLFTFSPKTRDSNDSVLGQNGPNPLLPGFTLIIDLCGYIWFPFSFHQPLIISHRGKICQTVISVTRHSLQHTLIQATNK